MAVFSIQYREPHPETYTGIKVTLLNDLDDQEFDTGVFWKDWYDFIKFCIGTVHASHFVGSSDVDHFQMDGGTEKLVQRQLFTKKLPIELKEVEDPDGLYFWIPEKLGNLDWSDWRTFCENFDKVHWLEAKALRNCINREELVHWLWEQDYFVNEEGEPIDQDMVRWYLLAADTENDQIEQIFKVINQEK